MLIFETTFVWKNKIRIFVFEILKILRFKTLKGIKRTDLKTFGALRSKFCSEEQKADISFLDEVFVNLRSKFVFRRSLKTCLCSSVGRAGD